MFQPLTAVILCGGAGERLHGAEKPLQPLLGRPLLEWVLERIRPQAERIVIVANRMADTYAMHGCTVVDDGRYRGNGPLAGIAAGLAAAATDWVLCVPGDAPLLPGDLAQRLQAALHRDQAEVALVHDGSGRQPLCCLLPRSALPALTAYLDQGGSAPRQWLARFRVAEADCSDQPRWAWSLNTLQEWQQVETELRQRSPS